VVTAALLLIGAAGYGYFTLNAAKSGEMSWSSRSLVTRDQSPRLFRLLLIGRSVSVLFAVGVAVAMALGWIHISN
jgi:uncharacterized membrane protein